MKKWSLIWLSVIFLSSCGNSFRNQTTPTTTLALTVTPEQVQSGMELTHLSSTSSIDKLEVSNEECYKSFHEFAYTLSDSDYPDRLLPTYPWQIEATLPGHQKEGFFFDDIQVEIVRSVDGDQEIWLAKPAIFPQHESESAFAIYRPESREWQEIPAKIENTDIFVRDLFLANDGAIWGNTVWAVPYGEEAMPNNGPVLSKFNEQSRQFEFVSGVLETPFTYEQSFLLPEIILDEQDIFWIFAQQDGLYRYDPVAQMITKQVDLPDSSVNDAALASDGRIYFENYDFRKLGSGEPSFRLYEGMLSQFIPDTGEVIELKLSDDPWPVFSGMLVTQNGQLWLGTTGFWQTDGTWQLIHPNPDVFFEHAGDPSWAPPRLVLESSDGFLWFQKYLGAGLRNEGTAWYNPKTGEGCMFTNFPANIVEDSQHQLWMFADSKLYKYSLEQ